MVFLRLRSINGDGKDLKKEMLTGVGVVCMVLSILKW